MDVFVLILNDTVISFANRLRNILYSYSNDWWFEVQLPHFSHNPLFYLIIIFEAPLLYYAICFHFFCISKDEVSMTCMHTQVVLLWMWLEFLYAIVISFYIFHSLLLTSGCGCLLETGRSHLWCALCFNLFALQVLRAMRHLLQLWWVYDWFGEPLSSNDEKHFVRRAKFNWLVQSSINPNTNI